jgi:hypothetical protein
MGLYHNRIQAPTKTLPADWIPEEGELFRDSAGNLYCGDNVTASNALTPVSNGAQGVKKWVAIASKTATGVPSFTVLENQLGTVVWTEEEPGVYIGTLAGAFPVAKTIFLTNQTASDVRQMALAGSGNGDTIILTNYGAGSPVDDNAQVTIMILVYP